MRLPKKVHRSNYSIFNGIRLQTVSWRNALVIVQPKTLNRWHRLGFRNSGATNPSPDGYTTYTSMIIQALEMIGEILHIENITRTLLGILTNSIYTILLILVGYSIAQGQDTEGTSDHPKIPGTRVQSLTDMKSRISMNTCCRWGP